MESSHHDFGAQGARFYRHIGSQIGRACLEGMFLPERAVSPENLCLLHPGPLLSAGDKMQLPYQEQSEGSSSLFLPDALLVS